MPDRARSRQSTSVVSIRPQRPATAEKAVHCTCNTDGQAPQAEREGAARIGLDDQVEVIGLERELDDAEVTASGPRERIPDRLR